MALVEIRFSLALFVGRQFPVKSFLFPPCAAFSKPSLPSPFGVAVTCAGEKYQPKNRSNEKHVHLKVPRKISI